MTVFVLVALAGIVTARLIGLYVGILGFVLATLAQTVWLWLRSRAPIAVVKRRDAIEAG